ncbi:YcxB family protein [Oribacterium sp. P6A1]|uniref:YcxB family protein n=1 Tax=Oribacterium sp. P6A1 TaxID=1410612 RepID=UPI00056179DC|nr:YcxB family protein [Oribacterium sp. P6A1]
MAYTEQNLAVFHSKITDSDFRRFSFYNGLIRNHSLIKTALFAVLLCLFGWCNYHAGMPLLCLSFVLPGLLLPFVYLFRYRKSVNTQIETLKLSREPKDAYTVGFTDRGIWINRGNEHVALDWERLDSAVSVKDATYLYYMKNRALILPDNALTLSDIASFKALLSEKMGQRQERKA